ncbi:MAG TPA: hypothetical protein VMQ51_03295, partial [Candidatus Binatia bacterium]|nr:hypothetical protein [Candidatus Binatia bacterium]
DQHRREQARDQRDGVGAAEPATRHTKADFEEELDEFRPLIIMPVFTFGGPYADDAENRRRTRYAVLSALAASSYLVNDNRRIGYVRLESGPVRVIPYEWLSGRDSKILLLWLDEDVPWKAPLLGLSVALRELGLCDDALRERLGPMPLRLKVIGPQTSSVIQHVIQELDVPQLVKVGHCFEKAELYTLSTAVDLSDRVEGFIHQANPLTAANGLTALRTIARDEDLLPVLWDELHRRGVDPAKDRIVLLGEWDTQYSRDLVTAAQAMLCGKGCAYVYLRGLDGFVPNTLPKPETPSADSSATLKLPSVGFGSQDPKRRERADGSSQLDYLRRLSAYVRDAEKALNPLGGVKAVGILGSDVYDKLLVLQALREAYPEAIFFTTDLDARFLQASDSQWARNLVVVSSFGLRLSESWQPRTPPFRDSYQTAQFFAVRLAMGEWPARFFAGKRMVVERPPRKQLSQTDLDIAMTPRTFEIGRTAAFDLSPLDSELHPRALPGAVISDALPDWSHIGYFVLALALAAALVIMASLRVRAVLAALAGQLRPCWRRVLLATIVAGAVIKTIGLAFWSAALSEGSHGEPFAWFEGVSVWPTEIIRTIAILIAVALLLDVGRVVRRTRRVLEQEFFEAIARGEVAPPAEEQTWFRALFGFSMPHPLNRSPIDTERLWFRYRRRTSLGQRASRIALLSLTFAVLGVVVIRRVFGPPAVPYRGGLSATADTAVLIASILAVTALLFSVSDAIWLCLRFLREVGRPVPTGWPDDVLKAESRRLAMPTEPLKAWLDVRFTATWSTALLRIVYYPGIVLCLLIIARSSFFDRWEPMPLGLALILFASLGITIGSAVSLRLTAERIRRNTLEILRRYLMHAESPSAQASPGATLSDARHPTGSSDQLRTLIAEVEAIRQGAFAPFAQQPFVKAALLPLSSAGGLAFLEWFVLGH